MTSKPFGYSLRIIINTVLLGFWCVFMVLVNIIWRLFRLPNLEKCYFIFHSGCCWLCHLNCHFSGELSTHRPTLFLSNHISYLDIFVLGSRLPAFFIAKSEVASWPILGWLARVQNTLFFERNSKKVRGQLGVMSEHFNKKGNLILFPEGTSTEGEHVEPFKSSLMQAVEIAHTKTLIQPVTIAYTHYCNKPMDKTLRDQYAWYASMPFASHFFNVLGMGKAKVEVIYHEPVSLEDFPSRKECALYCQQKVDGGLKTLLS